MLFSGNMDSGSETSPPQMEVALATEETVKQYVASVGSAILGAFNQTEELKDALDKSEMIAKFITDPQESVLVVDRTIQRGMCSKAT